MLVAETLVAGALLLIPPILVAGVPLKLLVQLVVNHHGVAVVLRLAEIGSRKCLWNPCDFTIC